MIRRLLMATLTTTAVAAAACGSGSGSGSGTSSTPASGAQALSVTVTETEFKIDMPASLKAGDYTLQVQNKGQFPHDVHIATPDGSEIGKSDVLQPNASGTLQVSLKAGTTYTVWCAVDSHKARGMTLNLSVT